MKNITILNLGAGVQSTALYLMLIRGEIVPQIDYAIFADTQDEPDAVYTHLKWLQSLSGPPILIGTAGRLSNDLRNGRNSTGQSFASIPAFTLNPATGKIGKTRRQCTREYKTDVIERIIRRTIVGLKPRQRFPKDVHIQQYIGISMDEEDRSWRIRDRFADVPWSTVRFPLLEKRMTRADCVQWLKDFGVPHEVPRSACVFCPYHNNEEWARIKQTDPTSWAKCVEVDKSLRIPGNIVNRGLDQQLFLHRSCVPLDQVKFDVANTKPELGMHEECEGMCGN